MKANNIEKIESFKYSIPLQESLSARVNYQPTTPLIAHCSTQILGCIVFLDLRSWGLQSLYAGRQWEPGVCELSGPIVVVYKVHPPTAGVANLPARREIAQLLILDFWSGQIPEIKILSSYKATRTEQIQITIAEYSS